MSLKKYGLGLIATMSAVVMLAGTVFAGADADHPLVTEGADQVTVDYDVTTGYEWSYSSTYSETGKDAYIAGNSGTQTISVSQISFTVEEAGTLTFDYEISTGSSGSQTFMAYNFNGAITLSNYLTVANYSTMDSYKDFRGEVDWSTKTLVITEDMLTDGTATVYIAYVRRTTTSDNGNYVAIANVEFESGQRDLEITATGGTVSGFDAEADTAVIGEEITLTATATSGNRFYGWVYNGEFQHCETDFTFNVATGDNEIEAVFAPDGTYEARGGGIFYTADDGGIEAALSAAQSGETVMLLADATLSSSVTVADGVTLYIPFDENIYYDSDTGEAVGFINGTSGSIAGSSYQYVELTVPENMSITVYGTLRVGGVNTGSYQSGTGYQGHLSGAYGEIVNNGTITSKNGATLDVPGLITGTGIVNAEAGSSVYEGFIVADYSGGTNVLALYMDFQAPFQLYAMQNIQTTFTIGSGSTLYGYCSLMTGGSSHNRTIAPIMSSDETCLFRFAESGTTVTRTYSDVEVDGYEGLGQMNYEVSGGMTFQSLTLEIFGVAITTDYVSFPIPYTYSFELDNGDYSVSNILTLLPGAEMYVGSNATFTVPESVTEMTYDDVDYTLYATLNVLDGLYQSEMSNKRLPYSEELQEAGYSASAMFTVDGTLKVENYGVFTGLVQTNGTGSIETGANAILTNTKFQVGGLSAYDDNRTWMDLTARINTADGIGYLIAGKVYEAVDDLTDDDFVLANYSLLYMENSTAALYASRDTTLGLYDIGYMSRYSDTTSIYHILQSKTVTIDQAMSGTWTGDVEMSKYYMNLSASEITTAVLPSFTAEYGFDVTYDNIIVVTIAIDGDTNFASAEFIVGYDVDVMRVVDGVADADGFDVDYSKSKYSSISENESWISAIYIGGTSTDADGYSLDDGSIVLGRMYLEVLDPDTYTSTEVWLSDVYVYEDADDLAAATVEYSNLTVTWGSTAVTETTPTPTYDEESATVSVTVDTMITLESDVDFTVYATTEDEDSTTTVVTLPITVTKQLDTLSSMTVETDQGTVVFNSTALDEISDNDDMSATLSVSVETDTNNETLVSFTTVTLDLLDDAGDKITFAGDDQLGTATVTVPYYLPDGYTVQVHYVNGDDREEIGATYANGYVTFATTHFSDFEISTVTVDDVTVTVTHVSYYTDGLVATTTSDVTLTDGTATFDVSLGENSGLYIYQVTYTLGDEAYAVYNANHSYTIAGVTEDLDITVTSYKRGDVTLDGSVNSGDALQILYKEASTVTFSDVQELVADVTGDGNFNSGDALQVLYLEANKILAFTFTFD